MLNISNEHTKFNQNPYSSLYHKLRKAGNFLHKLMQQTNKQLVGNYIFSWWSAIGHPTEPLNDSAIQYIKYGEQKRKQTKNPRLLPILGL